MEGIADAGVPEIEATPEMMEAGALALSEYDLELESLKEGATRIFRAMVSAHPGHQP